MFIRNEQCARTSKLALENTVATSEQISLAVVARFYENPLKTQGATPTAGTHFAEDKFREFCARRGTAKWSIDLDAELVRWVTEKTRATRIKPTKLLAMQFSRNKEGFKGGVEWDLLKPEGTKELDAYPALRQQFDSDESFTFQRQLKNRYVELCLLNRFLNEALPFVPIASIAAGGKSSLPTAKTSLLELFSNARHIIFDAVKTQLWEKGMEATLAHGTSKKVKLVLRRSLDNLGDSEAATLQVVHTHTFFGQAFERLHPLPPERLRHKARLWKVVLAGFRSHDAGGPYRESFSLMCQDLQSHKLQLFVKAPNNAQNVGTMRDAWVPNPAAKDHLSLEMFKFLGKLMGIAIRNKEYLSLSFAPLVWSKIVGSPVTYDILRQSHQALCLAMEHMSGWHETSNTVAKVSSLSASAQTPSSSSTAAVVPSPLPSTEEVLDTNPSTESNSNTGANKDLAPVPMRRIYSRGTFTIISSCITNVCVHIIIMRKRRQLITLHLVGGSMVENGELTADNFAEILGLTFDHCGLDGERVELYPGSGNRDVELADVREYASLRLKVKVTLGNGGPLHRLIA